MFIANTYRIMIGAPSDIREEVAIAKQIILEWTILNADTLKIVLLPLHWQDNAYPGYGIHPQKMLNKQLVDKSDMLVCIFGSKIGTATDTSDSGSIEEIEEHAKAGKPVMVLFKRNADINEITPEQLQKLKEFKQRIQSVALYSEFKDSSDFSEQFKKSLTLFVNDNWLQNVSVSASTNSHIQLTEEEREIFKKWASDEYGTPYTHINVMGGRTEIHLAYRFGVVLNTPKEKAWWEDFIERLLELRYIKFDKYDKHSHPTYKITDKGYKFAENI